MTAATPPSSSYDKVSLLEEPPNTLLGILSRLGPGLIVAGSIVGSGELIATTITGAKAGFSLLWLIILGCIIKVFVQVELGRYAVSTGKATIEAMNELPGPRLPGGGNWLVWCWIVMFVASLAQLGGIVGSVGQAMAISVPITQAGRDYNELADARKQREVLAAQVARSVGGDAAELAALIAANEQRLAELERSVTDVYGAATYSHWTDPQSAKDAQAAQVPQDDVVWAAVITIITAVLLMIGRYGFIQSFATVLVASFTLVTVVNVFWLQSKPAWAASWDELLLGLSFQLPPGDGLLGDGRVADGRVADGRAAVSTALMTFGIIGVGASELISYPYWCLEKGYARFTGPRDDSDAWGRRARGWMRVMQWDAWCSMVVYTFATIAFYILGAAILGRVGLTPEGTDLVRTLGVMYEPVFGAAAQAIFLLGAFAVLYSTFFVANASHARVVSDAVQVLGWGERSAAAARRRVRILSGLFPFVCLVFYIIFRKPTMLVLLSGMAQALLLPLLSAAALYYRYYRCDARLKPSRWWDGFLWLSSFGMLVCGVWLAWSEVGKLLK